jgi:hypothetical protein
MTVEQSSEDNDGHHVRATIGLAGGCALQRRSRRDPRAIRRLHRFRSIGRRGGRVPPLPPTATPRAIGSAAWADGLLLSFAQAGYVRTEPAILQPAEPFLDLSGEDIRKSLNGVLRRELSRARQFDRSTSA